MRTEILAIGVLALGMAAATPAAAELYRCEGPDGSAVFTDQKGACPGARAYEPVGRVTSSANSDAAPAAGATSADGSATAADATPADRAPAPAGPSPEEILERQWRQKKQEAEQAVQQIRVRRDQLRPLVSHCNRGGWVTARDDAGIKQRLNCSELKREFAKLDEAEAEARDYLEERLAEECRRAGCLPGWIR